MKKSGTQQIKFGYANNQDRKFIEQCSCQHNLIIGKQEYKKKLPNALNFNQIICGEDDEANNCKELQLQKKELDELMKREQITVDQMENEIQAMSKLSKINRSNYNSSNGISTFMQLEKRQTTSNIDLLRKAQFSPIRQRKVKASGAINPMGFK